MNDILWEGLRFAVLLFIVVFLKRSAKNQICIDNDGWRLIEAGFLLLLFAGFLDITDNFDSLNRFIIIGDTQVEAFLEKVVGYLGGFILLAMGLYRWIRSISRLKTEIEQRRAAEDALQQSEGKLRSIFKSAVIGMIVVIDDRGIISEWNTGAEHAFGYSEDEAVGKPLTLLMPERYREEHLNGFSSAVANGGLQHEGITHVLTGVRKNGDNFPIELTLGSWKQGEKIYFSAIILDISMRKKAEEEKLQLQRELSQVHKMEALGQLTSGIAHDFNNIIGIIMGYSGLAQERCNDKGDPKVAGYLENVQKATERAKDLVAQMMVFSRSDKGESHALQFAPLIKEELKLLRSILPSSIIIDFKYEDSLPSVVMDPIKLQQILMNLCVNAKDAMDGKGTLVIQLGWHRELNHKCSACHEKIQGDWIEISVADTGSGITPDTLERIFEPFFTTKEVGKGTGMGLSVLYGIINSHNGHIILETEQGKGTVFRLLFPPVLQESIEKNVKNKTLSVEDLQGYGQRVLIVDDEPGLANFVSETLGNHGYSCTVKTESPEALNLFTDDPDAFDLVITDQTMPELTGIEMIWQMRKLRSDMPVILTTGYSDAINRDGAEELNINFIDKPVKVDELAQFVANVLTNRN